MDLQAEYLERYKHYPPADMTWHELMAMVARVDRFEVRDRVIAAEAIEWGRPGIRDEGVGNLQRAKFERLAFPGRG